MALYATCMPLPSDTFHDKLFACDQGDHPDYRHEHWFVCSRQPSTTTGKHTRHKTTQILGIRNVHDLSIALTSQDTAAQVTFGESFPHDISTFSSLECYPHL